MAGTESTGPRRTVGLSTLLPYLRGYGPVAVTVSVLSLVSAGGTLAQPLVVRSVVDRLRNTEPATMLVVLLVLLLLGVGLINGVRSFLLQRTGEGLVRAIRHRLVGQLLRLPIAEYDRRRTGDMLSRVGSDTTLLRAVITSGLLELGTAAVIVVGAGVVMVFIDLVMFVVCAAALTGLAGATLIARRVRGASEHAQSRVGEMTAAVERAITATRTIRAARAEARETATVAASADQAYDAGVRMAWLQATVGPVVATTVQGGVLAVLGVGGARVAAGTLSVGDLVAFVLLLFMLMAPIGQAMNAYTQLQAGLGALQRIQDMLALPTEPADTPVAAAGNGAPVCTDTGPATSADRPAPTTSPTVPAIEFDRVDFSYPDGTGVLHDVSFTVPAGTRTALVGPSGAGKTTVLALVERFYEPAGGTVRVSGVDVTQQPCGGLRSQLGYVEQEAPVLAGTIRDNLLLTAPHADDPQLLSVLAAVNLTGLVERAPDGLDALVGEAGVLLSGGERQRLAIARALLAGPPILLLDEPTSNLDARNEQALRQAVDAAASQRTLLMVAHRLSTVADADQIIVLDGGEITAIGRHEELADTSPLYRELAAHQLLVR